MKRILHLVVTVLIRAVLPPTYTCCMHPDPGVGSVLNFR